MWPARAAVKKELVQLGNTDKRNLLDIAEQMLSQYPLCDQCLGRQFAWLSTDTSNQERGRSMKLLLSMQADEQIKSGDRVGGLKILTELAGNGSFGPARTLIKKNGIDPPSAGECHLCSLEGGSLFGRASEIAGRVVETTKNIEFNTFLIGCIPVPALAEREEELRARFSLLRGEPLKSDFNRELGKQVQKALGKEANFERSDIVIVYDMIRDTLDLQINPIFIYGRYRKLVRGIPQSRWDCTACGGRGCESCGGTGRRYPDSIAEYVGIPVQTLSQGTGFKFHGAGREDIDALMLGSGRPFVVEISRPRVRTLDFQELTRAINEGAQGRVEVAELQASQRERAQFLKHESSRNVKEYSAIIKSASQLEEQELRRAERELSGVEIEQRTPTRVSHRRKDLLRRKRVYEVKLSPREDGLLDGNFIVQGGTYVKELISGDDGRTRPSLSGILNTDCVCQELVVLSIRTAETDHNA